jgi:endonuclease-3
MKPDQVKSSSNPLVSSTRRVSPRKRPNVHSSEETTNSSELKRRVSKKARGSVKKGQPAIVKVESAATRPSPQECYFVTDALSKLHPHIIEENNKRREALLTSKQRLRGPEKKVSKHAMHTPVTDQIIGTMLSQNTTDANCHKAFANLKKDFPHGWDEVANVQDITRIENSIKVAGLAKTRAQRIQGMLQSIQAERGEASFEYLQSYESTDEIVKELSRFKGMGPKTISCVLLFALGGTISPWIHTYCVSRNKWDGLARQQPENQRMSISRKPSREIA